VDDQHEALLAIAQIALGLAGFSGVFVAMSQSGGQVRQHGDTYRLVLLLATSLSTLFLSLMPVALDRLGVADDLLWRVSNALFFVMLGALLSVVHRWRTLRREDIRPGETPAVAVGIWVLGGSMLVAELLSAAAVIGPPEGVFVLGLVFLVAFGSFLFARMLFLWRS
jgi:hypothetical protein